MYVKRVWSAELNSDALHQVLPTLPIGQTYKSLKPIKIKKRRCKVLLSFTADSSSKVGRCWNVIFGFGVVSRHLPLDYGHLEFEGRLGTKFWRWYLYQILRFAAGWLPIVLIFQKRPPIQKRTSFRNSVLKNDIFSEFSFKLSRKFRGKCEKSKSNPINRGGHAAPDFFSSNQSCR